MACPIDEAGDGQMSRDSHLTDVHGRIVREILT